MPDVLNTRTRDSDGAGSSAKVRVTTCGARCSAAPFPGSACRSSAWAPTPGAIAGTPSAISARRRGHLIVYRCKRTLSLDPTTVMDGPASTTSAALVYHTLRGGPKWARDHRGGTG